jgi:hypothetical protein
MLHPALARALAVAHIEDLQRTAARRHTIRLARRVAHAPHVAAGPIAIVQSASTRLRGRRAPEAEADGMTPTEVSQCGHRIADGFCSVTHMRDRAKAGGRWR